MKTLKSNAALLQKITAMFFIAIVFTSCETSDNANYEENKVLEREKALENFSEAIFILTKPEVVKESIADKNLYRDIILEDAKTLLSVYSSNFTAMNDNEIIRQAFELYAKNTQ